MKKSRNQLHVGEAGVSIEDHIEQVWRNKFDIL